MSWLSKALGNPIQTIAGGFLSGVLGGKKGDGFTPTAATLIDPFEQEQAKKLYEQTQNVYNQQQAFVNALAGQNALANQASVFNQLQNVASGQGPNPALAALQQATGQNIAGQSALMGGQRGASRNVGLLARQAGQQGGALQQQAGGQGALLQAQQQLGALGQLGGLANQQVAQQQAGLGALGQMGLSGQQNILDAIARQNAVAVNQQNALNQLNTQIAADKAKQQGGLLGNIGQMLGPIGAIAGTVLGGPVGGAIGGSLGGSLGGGSGIATTPAPNFGSYNFGQYSFAKGGEVKKPQYADGGLAAIQPQSFIGQYFQNPNQALNAINQSDNAKEQQLDYSTLADGGSVNRDGMYAKGGMAPKSLMDEGGKVPGQAVVKGDSYKNDIVDAKLSPGEIVIPRSIVNHPNAPELAAQFVRDTLSKKKGYADGGDVIKFNPDIIEKYTQGPINEQSVEQKPVQEIRQPASIEAKPTPNVEQLPSIGKGLLEQKQAYQETGRLAEQQAKQEELQYQSSLEKLTAQQDKYLSEISEVNNEMNNLRSDIMETKINPERLYSNMSTANKIGTVVGLILGGIGASYTGGENLALKQLNQEIDRDILNQRDELGKKQNLLGALTQKYGNVNQAMQMARIMMTDSLSLQMKKVASQYAGRIEAQRLNAEIAKLDQSIAQQVDTFAKARMYTSGEAAIPAELDPYRASRVELGEKPYYAESPQEANKIKDQIDQIDTALKTVKEMKKIRKQVGSETFPTTEKEKGQSLSKSLLYQAGPILLGQPITARNKELVEDQIPDPTRWNNKKFNQSINDIEQELITKRNDLAKRVYRIPQFNQKNISLQPSAGMLANPQVPAEGE